MFPDGGCIASTRSGRRSWAGNWRWNPRSNMVNEFVVGQNNFIRLQIPTADATKYTLRPAAFSLSIREFEYGNLRTINTYQFVDNMSLVTGAHNLKVGINFRYQVHTDTRGSVAGVNVSPLGNFSTSVNTVDPTLFNLPTTINTSNDRPNLQSAINLMLGRVGTLSQGFVQQGSSYGPGGTLFDFDARYPEMDFYAQDNWKWKPNVTVDLGVRWELKMSPSNPDNLIRRPNQSLAAGQPPSSTLRWDLGNLYEDDINNIGPSIGIAWDPKNDGKSAHPRQLPAGMRPHQHVLLSSTIFQSIRDHDRRVEHGLRHRGRPAARRSAGAPADGFA
jgi:hypothetical protein